jgi:hypothetical protein
MDIHPDWQYEPFAPFDSCPACLGHLQGRRPGARECFGCPVCGTSWQVVLGYLRQVSPEVLRGVPPARSADAPAAPSGV